MSRLTEVEILSRLRASLGEAIQASKDLAIKSRVGSPYSRLRDHLALIEGCCRQMAMWRGDYRWLPFGVAMANCHKRSGDMLRGHLEDGVFIPWSTGVINQNFVKLGAELGVVLEYLNTMATAKTGTLGPILPATPAEERRVGRPAFQNMAKRTPKLILPPRYRTG